MAAVAQMQSRMDQKLIGGIVGGLVGGVAFGGMMAMMGMLPMVASLVGSSSPIVGFLVHMGISAMIGASFGILLGSRSHSLGQGATWGLIYGTIWWILGPLMIMPIMMGMGLQFGMALSSPMLMSLLGHLIYGLVTGVVFAWFLRR